MHTSEVRDLVEHIVEVRDVASGVSVPFAVVAGLPPEIYEAMKATKDRVPIGGGR